MTFNGPYLDMIFKELKYEFEHVFLKRFTGSYLIPPEIECKCIESMNAGSNDWAIGEALFFISGDFMPRSQSSLYTAGKFWEDCEWRMVNRWGNKPIFNNGTIVHIRFDLTGFLHGLGHIIE